MFGSGERANISESIEQAVVLTGVVAECRCLLVLAFTIAAKHEGLARVFVAVFAGGNGLFVV